MTADQIKASKQSLLGMYEEMAKGHSFKPKQFVRWKEGLQNRSLPAYGEPAIVWQVLPQALIDEEKGTGSPYFHEPLDIVLGVLGENGEFILFHHDSRRFEPFPE
ncbi:MAG: hypothetical protein ABSH34_21115 [Verrucomicrobiota bacterium]